MKFNITKQVSRALLCLLLTAGTAFFSSFTFESSGGGIIITINDDNLRTEVGDPDDEVILIEVYDGTTKVYAESGCYDVLCISDLSGLPSGTYQAVAHSLLGEEASETISLP